MNRRRYLTGLGVGFGTFVSGLSGVTGESTTISVEILETNAPLDAGELLEAEAEIENDSDEEVSVDLEFVVGEDPEVESRRTVSVGPGETEIIDRLQFRTYPVLEDDEFPISVETEYGSDETTVSVSGVDQLDSQYMEPSSELSVQPGASVMFELDGSAFDDSSEIQWYVDGDSLGGVNGPYASHYQDAEGADFMLNTFDEEGTYDVAAAIVDQNEMVRWEVTVESDGVAPPTIAATDPETSDIPMDSEQELELEVSASDNELDRIIWWLTQSDTLQDISDVSGQQDTASIDSGYGCHTCQIQVWVLDEQNVYTDGSPWTFDDELSPDDEEDDPDGDDESIDVTIIDSNDPVSGGDILEVTAEIVNDGETATTETVEFVVGEDPEVVDDETVEIGGSETERVALEFETYPVEQADTFPVRVTAAESTDEIIVNVEAT